MFHWWNNKAVKRIIFSRETSIFTWSKFCFYIFQVSTDKSKGKINHSVHGRSRLAGGRSSWRSKRIWSIWSLLGTSQTYRKFPRTFEKLSKNFREVVQELLGTSGKLPKTFWELLGSCPRTSTNFWEVVQELPRTSGKLSKNFVELPGNCSRISENFWEIVQNLLGSCPKTLLKII